MPGLAAATENLSNFGQNIRGRTLLVLDTVVRSSAADLSLWRLVAALTAVLLLFGLIWEED